MNQPTTPVSDLGRVVPCGQIASVAGVTPVRVPTGPSNSNDIDVIPINAKTTQIRVKCGCGQTITLICESE